MSELLAGAARIKLHPPVGIAMIGYGNRVGRSTGIHDDLAAQALVLADGVNKAAIVSVDVLAIGPRIAAEICALVASRTDIPRDAIVVCATHTHSGPMFNIWATPKAETRDGGPDRDLDWERELPDKISNAVCSANQRLRPATIRAASTPFTLGTNRRLRMPNGDTILAANYAGIADDSAQLLGVYDSGANAIAFVINYPCHGVVLCEDNLLYSRDWMGFAIDEIEGLARNAGGNGPIGIFLNGATGNIDPRSRGGFEVAENHGRELGRCAFEALQASHPIRESQLLTRCITLKLRIKDLVPTLTSSREFVAQTTLSLNNHRGGDGYQLKRLRDHRDRAVALLANVEALDKANRHDRRVNYDSGEMATNVSIIALGDIAIVGIPGELFVELGLTLRRNPSFAHTLVAGYCNDLIGYIPVNNAYAEGGYEVATARVAAGTGETMVDIAVAELARMAAEREYC
jgi:neutral ceramidase